MKKLTIHSEYKLFECTQIPLPVKRYSCSASPCFCFFFISQSLTVNKIMLQLLIVFAPFYKNMCKQNVFCNLGMQTGANLPKSFNLATDQPGCNYSILATKQQLLMSSGQHQIARYCSCSDLKILIK